MKTKYLLALLALAGSAISTQATTVSVGLNDLVLGFRATGGTGATTNLEINLGNVSNFYGVSGQVTLTGLNVADLSSTFGASWNTRSDLLWGVIGTTGNAAGTTAGGNAIAASTLWASKSESTLTLQSTPWTQANVSAQQGPANTISTLYNGATASLNGATATGNSATAALLSNSVNGSWSRQEGTVAFGFFTRSQFENNTNFGSSSIVASDLYQVQPTGGPAVYVGTFALNNNGTLVFGNSPNAVPEPSSYAAIFGAVVLGFVALRRRRAKN
ncbi:MAG: PEP-CTERM sorting domain-containing protein [Verrucomicrobiota bacterium]